MGVLCISNVVSGMDRGSMVRKRNIALLISALHQGGAERVVSRLSYILSERYDVFVFLIDTGEQFYECGCPVIDVGGDKRGFRAKEINCAININKYLKKYNIDSMISFMGASNFINIVFAKNVKRIISIRACYNKMLKDVIKDEKGYYTEVLLQKILYKYANQIVTVSKVQEYLLRKELGENANITTIENPIDIVEIKMLAKEPIDSDVEKFIKTHYTTVAVGRICYQKNYELMIDIFEHLVDTNPRAGLLILGAGDKEHLKQILANRKLEKNVRIIGSIKNPFAYIGKCRCYISTSRYEGFPNALIEAMACGIPVISTDCFTGPQEIIQDDTIKEVKDVIVGDYGILIPDIYRTMLVDDKDRVLNSISNIWNKILTDYEFASDYAHKAAIRCEKYSKENCAKKWIKLIEE